MTSKIKFVALAAIAAMLVPAASSEAAQRYGQRTARYYYRPVPAPVPLGYYGGGSYGYTGDYGTGWRLRSNAKGWDNTCLDVPWLPSQFACSAR